MMLGDFRRKVLARHARNTARADVHYSAAMELLCEIAKGTHLKFEVTCEWSDKNYFFLYAVDLLRYEYITATIARFNVAKLIGQDSVVYKAMDNIELTEKGRVALAAYQLSLG